MDATAEKFAESLFSNTVNKSRRAQRRERDLKIKTRNRLRHAHGKGKHYSHFTAFNETPFTPMGAN
jgi:hypothetical protein